MQNPRIYSGEVIMINKINTIQSPGDESLNPADI